MVRYALAAIVVAALPCRTAAQGVQAEELLRDPAFANGFTVFDPAPGKHVVTGKLQPEGDTSEPAWGLAQWHSRATIAGVRGQMLPSGAAVFANPAKSVTLACGDAPEADLRLAVSAFYEYDGKARQKGDNWPHLLASQTFTDSPALGDLAALRYQVGVRLLECEPHEVPGLDPKLHAAQFLSFITLQNRNRQSPGYGDFVWFGIPLYDSRYRIPRKFVAPDVAHKKLIYTPAGEAYTDQSVHDGEWVTIDRDILPLMHEALRTAWERGCLLDSQDLADYRFGSISIGWEVPGPLDVEMQVRGLSLKATMR